MLSFFLRATKLIGASVILAVMLTLTVKNIQEGLYGPSVRQVYDKTSESVAIIKLPNVGYGSAFAAQGKSGKKYMITNAHVCEAAEKGLVKVQLEMNEGPMLLDATIVAISEVTDLCAITFKGNSLKPLKLAKFVNFNEQVFASGYPSVEFLSVIEGITIGSDIYNAISDRPISTCVGPKYTVMTMLLGKRVRDVCVVHGVSLVTTIHGDVGCSGSPIVNSELEVVGVANTVYGRGMISAVPLPELVDFLNTL